MARCPRFSSAPKLKAVELIPAEQAVPEYAALNAKITAAEKRKKILKPHIERAVRELPDLVLEIAGHLASMIWVKGESFDLKSARKKIDGRVLRPYIRDTSGYRLLVK